MDDLWTFSPATRRWTRREATGGPGPLTGHAACRLRGDRALVFGGARPEAEHSNETYVLDLKTSTWARRAPGPAARDFHLLLPSREGVLMWGGVDDGFVIKASATTGKAEWIKHYPESNRDAQVVGVDVDASGNVFGSGYSCFSMWSKRRLRGAPQLATPIP